MKFLIEFFHFKEKLSMGRMKVVLYSAILGLLIALLCSGKPYLSMALESIAVSPDEQYIACFETSSAYKIHCFHADGSMAFTYNIPVDISAGGHCSLWFEDDGLYALFFRTDKILHFSFCGSVLNLSDATTEKSRPEFPDFSESGHQLIFSGTKINVVYDKGYFVEYWLLGSKRYLAITPIGSEPQIIYAWTAKKGAMH